MNSNVAVTITDLNQLSVHELPLGIKRQGNLDEWWTIFRLVKALVRSDLLSLPLTICHQGNSFPDFRVKSASVERGIEITKVAEGDYEEASSHLKRRNRSLIVMDKNNPIPLIGDLGALCVAMPNSTEWAEKVLGIIERKATIAAKSPCNLSSTSLLVLDRLDWQAYPFREKCMALVSLLKSKVWDTPPFTHLFVECQYHESLIRIDLRTGKWKILRGLND